MPTISVIVPVYKVEQYLHRCVDSILAQTYTDFELILVDDGSPDNCGKICDEYKENDNRVVVIHKENGGVSSARNAGLDIAKGKWIAFVDSDDWVEKEYLGSLLHDDVDFVCQTAICLYECGEIKNIYENENRCYNISLNIIRELLCCGKLDTVWGKAYRKDIIKINNIIFDYTLDCGEDTFFNVQYAICSKAILSENIANYKYVIYKSRDTLSSKRCLLNKSKMLETANVKICDLLYSDNKFKWCELFSKRMTAIYNAVISDNISFWVLKDFKKNIKFLCHMAKNKYFLICIRKSDNIIINKSIRSAVISGNPLLITIVYTYLQIVCCAKEWIKRRQ